MIRIPQLPKWCLTNALPAFHDYESLTAVDQTARLYATMQGLIDDYNKFASEVNTTIETFINDLNGNQEEFENKITKLVHDYIAMLDEKIKMQDKEIEDAVLYMKDNISNSITEIIAQMKEMGEFDEAVLNAIDGVGTRMTTLETSMTNAENRILNLENSNVKLIYDSESESLNFENVEVII